MRQALVETHASLQTKVPAREVFRKTNLELILPHDDQTTVVDAQLFDRSGHPRSRIADCWGCRDDCPNQSPRCQESAKDPVGKGLRVVGGHADNPLCDFEQKHIEGRKYAFPFGNECLSLTCILHLRLYLTAKTRVRRSLIFFSCLVHFSWIFSKDPKVKSWFVKTR